MRVKNYYEETDNAKPIASTTNKTTNKKATTYGDATTYGKATTNSVADTLSQYANSSDTAKKTVSKSALDQYLENERNTTNTKQELYQAQANAKKYNDTALKSAGLSTQGYVQSVNQGTDNAYMRGIQQANNNSSANAQQILDSYNTQIGAIDEQNKATAQSTAYDFASQELTGAKSTAEYDEILSKYKDQISDDQYKQLELAVNQSKDNAFFNQYGVSNTIGQDVTNTSLNTNMSDADITKWLANTGWNDSKKANSKQTQSIKKLVEMARKGELSDGTIYDLNAGGGKDKFVYYKGTFYKID